MHLKHAVSVIIPAYNEQDSIGKVIKAIPSFVDEIIVVNNGSTDQTATIANALGARVFYESKRGYGAACLKGIEVLKHKDVVVFLDGDFSDYPGDMDQLIKPITQGWCDLVIGSRNLGGAQPGSLTPQARFGNWLACLLIKWFWKIKFTDLGPFRAIRYEALQLLNMQDQNYGWTVEMQVKASMCNLPVIETPVGYRRRIGHSKISGTIKGVIGAGTKILGTIFLAQSGLLPKWSAQPTDHIIIMSRYPEAGKTKTRLIPALGPDGAAKQQLMMTEHIMRIMRQLQRFRRISIELRYFGGNQAKWRAWLGQDLCFHRQGSGNLGQKMGRAFKEAFKSGKKNIVMVGTDCAQITVDLLNQAFEQLNQADLTLGPALDGGYYLIGLRKNWSALFNNIKWGTNQVWSETMQIIKQNHIPFLSLPARSDIDRPEDLSIWNQAKELQTKQGPSISVIIPVLNEANYLETTLKQLTTIKSLEVIIVDGGSQDSTRKLVRKFDAKLLSSQPNRARQMNIGANQAHGDILLFLHGDTMVPEGMEITIQELLSRPGTSLGAFQLAIHNSNRHENHISFWANWRSKKLALPYGDQGLFLYRYLFNQINGYQEYPIMEDYDFVRRVKKRGNIITAKQAVYTSGRRWRRLGIFKTTIINQLIVIGYHLGVPLRTLKKLYRNSK